MVGFDDLKNKASEVLKDEEKTDQGLDAASDFINDKTGGQHADKIEQGRDFLDGKVGDER
ncbi:antitoxin [Ruania alkalisoli]|uniref:Antitoxin n=1 Tax=Ruania alkalisoli TaxID=2779775 RepID=A0A7M1SRU3_9MICO|nr:MULTISPECIES: antitoxin [Ruania]QOR70276.1 antitoxin [Ruania alkalisoli]